MLLRASGKWIAGGTSEGLIHVWGLDDLTLPSKIIQSNGKLNDLRFSPTGQNLAIANRNITLVTLPNTHEQHVIRNDGANYGSVRFSSDGRSLLTVSGIGRVTMMSLASGAVRSIHCCTSIWGDVVFTPDEAGYFGLDIGPALWDLRVDALAGRLTENRKIMTLGPIGLDASGSVFMGSQDGRVYQWDLATRRLLRTSPPQSGYVRTIAVLGGSGWIAYAAEDGPVHLWSPQTAASQTVPSARPTSNLVYDDAKKRTALGTVSRQVEFWDLIEGRIMSTLSPQ